MPSTQCSRAGAELQHGHQCAGENPDYRVDAAMRELIGKRPWLAVFRFPTYTPDLNPAAGGLGAPEEEPAPRPPD
ncbi:hypothetical protein ACIA8P_02025 [Streptomyces cellulosae]|uniref:Tc1-like transposase DDE domain-containing protein n=1 Tax=Streptomyces cellulosae TaxID=1968 RepID=A0ABW7XTM9_STRCE